MSDTLTIKEHCSCGGEFVWQGTTFQASTAVLAVEDWRRTHQHERPSRRVIAGASRVRGRR